MSPIDLKYAIEITCSYLDKYADTYAKRVFITSGMSEDSIKRMLWALVVSALDTQKLEKVKDSNEGDSK